MGALQSLRLKLRQAALKKRLRQPARRQGKPMNLDHAASVGILFNATSPDDRKAALLYADQLKKRNKQVHVLGYFDHKLLPDALMDFPCFTPKEISWSLQPKGEAVNFFLDQEFDIFVHLNPTTTLHSEYIAALTNAFLKVGPVTDATYCYDLMIDLEAGAGIPAFIREMEALLKKTNN